MLLLLLSIPVIPNRGEAWTVNQKRLKNTALYFIPAVPNLFLFTYQSFDDITQILAILQGI